MNTSLLFTPSFFFPKTTNSIFSKEQSLKPLVYCWDSQITLLFQKMITCYIFLICTHPKSFSWKCSLPQRLFLPTSNKLSFLPYLSVISPKPMSFQCPQNTAWRSKVYPCMEKHSMGKWDNVFNIYECGDYKLIQAFPVSTGQTVPLLIEIRSWLVIQSKFQSDDLWEKFLKSHN